MNSIENLKRKMLRKYIRINSSIGSQWKTRAMELEDEVKKYVTNKELPKEDLGKTHLNQRIKVLWVRQEIDWYFFDDEFQETYWQWNPYFEAIETYGEPEYDECFGYEPLLSLGGDESVDYLRKVNYKIHITLMSEFQGVLS